MPVHRPFLSKFGILRDFKDKRDTFRYYLHKKSYFGVVLIVFVTFKCEFTFYFKVRRKKDLLAMHFTLVNFT